MRACTLLLSCVALLASSVTTAHAIDFYSVDTSSSELKIVSTSGSVSTIGSLGRTVADIDLASLNGHLYAIDAIHGSRVELLKIDVTTGTATLLGTVKESGVSATAAEALAARDGHLWIGYSTTVGGISSRLARLGLDGTIDVATVLATNADIDSLVWNGTEWRAIDVNTPAGGISTLFGGTGPNFGVLATDTNAVLATNDLHFVGADLWGTRAGGTSGLVRLNADTGASLETITFAFSGTYSNLAPVPEPATFALLAAAASALLVRRRSRIN